MIKLSKEVSTLHTQKVELIEKIRKVMADFSDIIFSQTKDVFESSNFTVTRYSHYEIEISYNNIDLFRLQICSFNNYELEPTNSLLLVNSYNTRVGSFETVKAMSDAYRLVNELFFITDSFKDSFLETFEVYIELSENIKSVGVKLNTALDIYKEGVKSVVEAHIQSGEPITFEQPKRIKYMDVANFMQPTNFNIDFSTILLIESITFIGVGVKNQYDVSVSMSLTDTSETLLVLTPTQTYSFVINNLKKFIDSKIF
jgi:hypothetical protein